MRDRNQVVLPLNLEINIPKDDFVFKVAEICEQLDYTELLETYIRTWRKVNPITLFEILVFGYRTIRVNQVLNEHRPKVLEALTSNEGALLRMNRSIQVEVLRCNCPHITKTALLSGSLFILRRQ